MIFQLNDLRKFSASKIVYPPITVLYKTHILLYILILLNGHGITT